MKINTDKNILRVESVTYNTLVLFGKKIDINLIGGVKITRVSDSYSCIIRKSFFESSNFEAKKIFNVDEDKAITIGISILDKDDNVIDTIKFFSQNYDNIEKFYLTVHIFAYDLAYLLVTNGCEALQWDLEL